MLRVESLSSFENIPGTFIETNILKKQTTKKRESLAKFLNGGNSKIVSDGSILHLEREKER